MFLITVEPPYLDFTLYIVNTIGEEVFDDGTIIL